jgi:hypothetical protein
MVRCMVGSFVLLSSHGPVKPRAMHSKPLYSLEYHMHCSDFKGWTMSREEKERVYLRSVGIGTWRKT